MSARTPAPPLPQRDGLDAIRVVIRPHEVGLSMREVLLARFPALAQSTAEPFEQRLARGDFVDAHALPYTGSEVAERSREVYFYRELAPEPDERPHVPIVFEDEHLLVINKPRGMASIPRGEHIQRSALVRLRRERQLPELSPLHRLDKLTGGLLLFSKRASERGPYQTLFANALVRKRYLALVDTRLAPRSDGTRERANAPGEPYAEEALEHLAHASLDMRAPIVKNHGDLWAHVHPAGKTAHTRASLVDRRGPRALLALDLFTGRTHQIRVHLAHHGLPIVGDELYPHPQLPDDGSVRTRREVHEPLHLWCTHMAFTDPLTGRERAFHIPPPLTQAA